MIRGEGRQKKFFLRGRARGANLPHLSKICIGKEGYPLSLSYSTQQPGAPDVHTFARSTKSLSRMTSTERGSCPAGAFSGISWILRVWWSLYTDRPYSVSKTFPSSSWASKGGSLEAIGGGATPTPWNHPNQDLHTKETSLFRACFMYYQGLIDSTRRGHVTSRNFNKWTPVFTRNTHSNKHQSQAN